MDHGVIFGLALLARRFYIRLSGLHPLDAMLFTTDAPLLSALHVTSVACWGDDREHGAFLLCAETNPCAPTDDAR